MNIVRACIGVACSAGVAFVIVEALSACGDDPARPTVVQVDGGSRIDCKKDPLICPPGETCWFTNAAATEFACLTSGEAGLNELCRAFPNAASCTDDLLCITVTDGGSTQQARCSAYCTADSSVDTCGEGTVCQIADFASLARLPLCLPGNKPKPRDAGEDG